MLDTSRKSDAKTSPMVGRGPLEGRTAMHAPEIDGKVFVTDLPEEIVPEAGQFYRCQITEAHEYDLVARIV